MLFQTMKTIYPIIFALLAGEITLILLATVAQEVLFDGIRYLSSSKTELFWGGLATFAAAIIAGMTARLVIKDPKHIVPSGISFLIITETTYLTISDKTGDPWWVDALAGFSLIIGIWIGFYWREVIAMLSKNHHTKMPVE